MSGLRLTAAQRDALLRGADWIEANPDRWLRDELATVKDGTLCLCALGAAIYVTLPDVADWPDFGGWRDGMSADEPSDVADLLESLSNQWGPEAKEIGDVNDSSQTAAEAVARIRELVAGAVVNG